MSGSVEAPAPSVSTAELRTGLERALVDRFGPRGRVADLERRPSAYRTSFPIEELDVRLADGTGVPLMFKDLAWQTLTEGARRAKPAFLHDPLREIEVYRAILAPSRLGTPEYYGAVVDRRRERYWLFLERVAGVELYQVGELATWQAVARWLAAMHARFAPDAAAGELPGAVPLLRYDGDFYLRWPRRALAFARRTRPSDLAAIEWLAQRHERVVERLVALPVTFLHGEFYASNVLVQQRPDGLRVSPIDWEMAAIGPGLIDLAALTAGGWSEAERTALALAYHAALPSVGGQPEAFLAALDACQLHLAVQWLGWSPDWSPPREHAQDWLGVALRLAEKLGL